NARSKKKILDLIDGLSSHELPYDIQLRSWIKEKRLKAGFTFPFLTTASSQADCSEIQLRKFQVRDMVMNAYRRLVWLDFEQFRENPVESLNKLDAGRFDVQSLYFSQILSVILSEPVAAK
ncbi:MAG: hypothetical protein LBD06_09165, partial [Candidatus Accumulibacter sp.]|nr:hypothetical protein [Accumulibacter sp.]